MLNSGLDRLPTTIIIIVAVFQMLKLNVHVFVMQLSTWQTCTTTTSLAMHVTWLLQIEESENNHTCRRLCSR